MHGRKRVHEDPVFGPGYLLAVAVRIKVLGPDIVAKHDVVVQVDELARDAGDPVQVRFDCRGANRDPIGRPRSVLACRHGER